MDSNNIIKDKVTQADEENRQIKIANAEVYLTCRGHASIALTRLFIEESKPINVALFCAFFKNSTTARRFWTLLLSISLGGCGSVENSSINSNIFDIGWAI